MGANAHLTTTAPVLAGSVTSFGTSGRLDECSTKAMPSLASRKQSPIDAQHAQMLLAGVIKVVDADIDFREVHLSHRGLIVRSH
jgi:hypothetical protein